MKSAGTVSGHLARLLLLACTVLGVAALHTIGHAGLGDLDRHHPAAASVVVEGLGGCDGDGCLHHAAGSGGAADTSRWWEVCVAILGALAACVLAARQWSRARGAAVEVSVPARRRPPPHRVRGPTAGLILATAAVLRT
ncbi:hypothetical protein EV385_5077 [Krasilnikovia cinnamomea]|uniref:Uncharacterized protein n=1 Tax=Krasilnikovia cinnamomea TaxID=349313 RepID=A0A4Q7ZQ20_9ACTN|nr:hypothetical protein [Krasilnikovia cinnamomea]RZU53187.1 hypothetical protein EV385_5077 [Krasilnikovia cinnamomea]